MAKYSNTLEYKLKSTLDNSGFTKLRSEITTTQNSLRKFSESTVTAFSDAFEKAEVQLSSLQTALSKSFNAKNGILDLTSFNTQMSETSLNMTKFQQGFAGISSAGQGAFADLIAQLGKFDVSLRTTSSAVDKLINTMGNTLRWGVTASIFETVSNRLADCVNYVQELDESLNNIRIVSEYTAEDMREFSLYANEAAKALGSTTTAYTNASLIYAQQGYNLEDSEKLANLTIEVANTTGQTTAEVSEQMTAWINGYSLSIDELEGTLDKVTKVAAVGASDTEELMTAASKVASTASTLGVSTDQLISQMSTIISVTREAPENIGNSLKTIYARLGDLSLGEELEDGTTLGNLSGTLEEIGVQVLDVNGSMRDMGDIIEDLMNVWDDFDTGTKQALAVKLAGKYQYNRLLALLENSDMYYETLNESENSEGFLSSTQSIYGESLAAKLTALSTAVEQTATIAFDPENVKPFISALTDAISLFNDFISAIDISKSGIWALGAAFTKVFNDNISASITSIISNYNLRKTSDQNEAAAAKILSGITVDDTETKDLVDYLNSTRSGTSLTQEQQRESNTYVDKYVESLQKQKQVEQELKATIDQINVSYRSKNGATADLIDSTGKLTEAGKIQLQALQNEEHMRISQAAWEENVTYLFNDQKLTLDELNNAAEVAQYSITQLLNVAKNSDGTFNNTAINSIKEWFNSVNALYEKNQISGVPQTVMATLQEYSAGLLNATDINNPNAELAETYLTRMKAYITEYQNSLYKTDDELSVAVKRVGELRDGWESAKTEVSTVKEQMDDFANEVKLQQAVTDVVSLTSSVSQLVMAYTSLRNILDIINSDDYTGFEKIIAIVENLAFSIPSIISGVSAIVQLKDALYNKETGESAFKTIFGSVGSLNDQTKAKQQAAIDEIKQKQNELAEKEAKKEAEKKAAELAAQQAEEAEKELVSQKKTLQVLQAKQKALEEENIAISNINTAFANQLAMNEQEIKQLKEAKKAAIKRGASTEEIDNQIKLLQEYNREYKGYIDKSNKQIAANSEKYSELSTSISETNGKIEQLNSTKQRQTTVENASAEAIEKDVAATEALGASSKKAATSVKSTTAAIEGAGTAAVATQGKIAKLATSLSSIGKGLLASFGIMAAFELVGRAYEYLTTYRDELIESAQEAEDEATERLENIATARESFFEQYNEYKENGVITDELRDSLSEYNEALGQTIETENIRKDTLDRLIDATLSYADAQEQLALKDMVDAKNAKFSALSGVTNGLQTDVIGSAWYGDGNGTDNLFYQMVEEYLGDNALGYGTNGYFISADADQEQVYAGLVQMQADLIAKENDIVNSQSERDEQIVALVEEVNELQQENNPDNTDRITEMVAEIRSLQSVGESTDEIDDALSTLSSLIDTYSFIVDDQATIFQAAFSESAMERYIRENNVTLDENGKFSDEDAQAWIDALLSSSYTKDLIEASSYDTALTLLENSAYGYLSDDQLQTIEDYINGASVTYETLSKNMISSQLGYGSAYGLTDEDQQRIVDSVYDGLVSSLSDVFGEDVNQASLYSSLKNANSNGLNVVEYQDLAKQLAENSSVLEAMTGKTVQELLSDSSFMEAIQSDYDNGINIGEATLAYVDSIAEAKKWTDLQASALEDNVANQKKLAELQGEEFDEDDVTETVQGFLDSISAIEDEAVRAAAIADLAANAGYNEDNLALARLGITGVDTESEAGQAMLDIKDWFATWAAENKTSMTAEAAGTYVTKVSDLIEELAGGDDDIRQSLLEAIEDMDPAEAYTWLFNGSRDGTSAGVMLAAKEYGVSDSTAEAFTNKAAEIDAARAARGLDTQDTEGILYDLYSYMSGLGMSEDAIVEFVDNLGTTFSEDVAKNDALLSVMGSKYSDSTSSGGQLAIAINEAMADLGLDLDQQYAMVNETVDNIEKLADGDVDAIEALTDLFDDYDPDFVAAAVRDGVENGMTSNGVVKMLETGYSRERINGIESTAARISENSVKAGGSEFDGEDIYTLYEFAEGLGIAAEGVDTYVASLGTVFDLDEAESNLVDAQMGITEETRKLLDAVGLDDLATDYRDYLMENGATADEANTSAGSLSTTLGTTFTESQLSALSESLGGNVGALGDAVTKLSEAGVDGYSQYQLLARIDPDKSAEEINAQIDYMISSGMVEQVSLLADAEEVRDIYQEAADEFSSDGRVSEATYKQLMDLDDSVAGMRVDSQELGRYLDDMARATEKNADAIRDTMEESYDLDYDIDTGLFTDFEDSVRDFFDDDFSIDVEMTVDAHDASDQLIESFQEISDVIETIGDDYTVSLDDFDDLYSEFGESLLENAYITEDGLLQLDQATTDQMIANRQAEKDAAVQARIDELTAEQTMHEQKAQAYQAAAEATAQLSAQVSAGEIQNASDVATAQSEIATELTGKLEEAQIDQATAVQDSSESQIDNIYAIGEQSDTTFSSVAANAASGSSSMATSVYTAAKNAIENYHQMAVAVKAALSGEEAGSAVSPSSSGSSYSGTTGSKSTTTSYSGGTASDYTISSSDSLSTMLSKLQQSQAYYEGLASAESQLSSQLAGAITELQLSGASTYETPSSRASSGSSSGSSGSSSDSSYEPKETEITEDELDRYERVDTALDAISNDLEKLADEQERLTGKDLLDNMEKQVGLLRDQLEVQEQKLAIQKDELAEYDERLASEYGVTFTDDGYVANYAERFNYYLGYLNSLEQQYNAATTEEAQDALQDQIDAAKDAFDDYKDLIDKRDELFSNSIKESEQAIQEYYDEIEDMMIGALDDAIDMIDELEDLNDLMAELHQIGKGLRSDNPFRELATDLEKISKFNDALTANNSIAAIISANNEKLASDDLTAAQRATLTGINAIYQNAMDTGATSIVDMYANAMELVQDQIEQFNSTGSASIFGEDSAAMYETAQTVLEGYKNALEEEEEYYETLEDEIGDAIDYQNDKIERRYELFEDITEDLEHQYKLIELTRGEEAYDDLNSLLQLQIASNDAKIAAKEAEKEYWAELQKGMQEGSDNWNDLADKIRDATEEIQSLVEDSVEKLQEEYENLTNKALDTWTSSLLGDDLEWAQDQWDLINRNADQYLDAVNSAYETQKLQSKYLDLLDGANTLKTQKLITEQMNKQMDYLRGQTVLSEYDVAYANAQLEILQKQIALEEAQANKSTMKLRRDSQGNYSYVYTADDDAVDSAASDLLDAQNEAYNLTKDNIVQVQSDMLSVVSDAYQRIQDIQNNMLLSQEEKNERIKDIVDATTEYVEGLSQQLGVSEEHILDDFVGMVDLMNEANAASLQDYYEQALAGNDDFLTQIDERFSTSISDQLEDIEGILNATGDMYDQMLEVNDQYYSDVEDTLASVGDSYGELTDNIQSTLDATNSLSEGTQAFFEVLNKESGAITQAQDALSAYAVQIADVNNKYAEANERADKLAAELEEQKQETANLSNALLIAQQNSSGNNGTSGGSSTAGGSAGTSGGSLDTGSLHTGQIVGYRGMYYYDSWGKSPAGNQYAGQEGAVTVDSYSSTKYGGKASQTGDYDVHISSTSGGDLGWVKSLQLFDTGGYIPEDEFNGNEGRIAMLHKKEIVLNESDTSNILAAVDAVRQVATTLKEGAFDAIVSNMALSGEMMESAMSGTQKVEQSISIDATFPNVYNAEDIRDAILSLADNASQFAYRVK